MAKNGKRKAVALAGLVEERDGQPMTTSLLVAEKFGKRHDNVLQKIDALVASQPEFSALNFKESSYLAENGKNVRMYAMTEEGFAMIAMRFTGRAAEEWQIKFIRDFQAMRRVIERGLRQQAAANWRLAREAGKDDRSVIGEAMQNFVDWAASLGSENPQKYFKHFSNCVAKAIGLKGAKRDTLAEPELKLLAACERAAADEIDAVIGIEAPSEWLAAETAKRARKGKGPARAYHYAYAAARPAIEARCARVQSRLTRRARMAALPRAVAA